MVMEEAHVYQQLLSFTTQQKPSDSTSIKSSDTSIKSSGSAINGNMNEPSLVLNTTPMDAASSDSYTANEEDIQKTAANDSEQRPCKRDLFAVYEQLNCSFEDLTFKQFCTGAPPAAAINKSSSTTSSSTLITQSCSSHEFSINKRNTNIAVESAISDASLDFAAGLAAIAVSSTPGHYDNNYGTIVLTGGVQLRSQSVSLGALDSSLINTQDQRENSELALLKARDSNASASTASASARNSTGAQRDYNHNTIAGVMMTKDSPSPPQKTENVNKEGGASHTNYCSTCSKYILFFKTRCLVCGKCYCLSCVKDGMGSMPEGRKCKVCLGKRFSERYIQKAGKGCFLMLSNAAKMAEIKWARKKPKIGRAIPTSPLRNGSSSSRRYHSQTLSRTSTSTPPYSPRRDSYSNRHSYDFNPHPSII